MAFSESELLLEYHSGVTTAHRNLLQYDSLSDLHVKVGKRSFPCHKLIMTSWSGYFRSMLNSDWGERHESQVTLPADDDIISAASFELIYNWIYHGQLEPTLDNLDLMLPTVHYLQMHQVLGMCVEQMQLVYDTKEVPVNRMVQNLVLGKRFDIAPLRQMALRGIATQFDSFLSSIDFREHADVEDILTLLKNPDLVTSSEDVVLQIAIGWLRHKSERLDHLTDVLENIRLGCVATQTLRECLDHQVMSHSVTSCDLLLDVLCQPASPACKQRLKRYHPKVLQERNRNPQRRKKKSGRVDARLIYAGMARDTYQSLRECHHQPTDVTVAVESAEFPVHKAILVGWSAYFRRVLSEGSLETVSLSGEAMTVDNLDILLKWIYLGEYHVTAKNVCDVLVCARSLQMDNIAELLDKYFKQILAPKLASLSGSDLMALLLRARKHNLTVVQQAVLNTVVHNFSTLKDTQEFKDAVNLSDLLFILEHDELNADNENQVFQSAIEWLQHSEDRHTDLAKVIKVVRMAFVDVPIIRTMLNKIAPPDAESYQILLNALARDSDPASLKSLREACPGMFKARKTTTKKKVLVRYEDASLRTRCMQGQTTQHGTLQQYEDASLRTRCMQGQTTQQGTLQQYGDASFRAHFMQGQTTQQGTLQQYGDASFRTRCMQGQTTQQGTRKRMSDGLVLNLETGPPRWYPAKVPDLRDVTCFCEADEELYGIDQSQGLVRWDKTTGTWEVVRRVDNVFHIEHTTDGSLLLVSRPSHHDPQSFNFGFGAACPMQLSQPRVCKIGQSGASFTVHEFDTRTGSLRCAGEWKPQNARGDPFGNPHSVGGFDRSRQRQGGIDTPGGPCTLVSVCSTSKGTVLALCREVNNSWWILESDSRHGDNPRPQSSWRLDLRESEDMAPTRNLVAFGQIPTTGFGNNPHQGLAETQTPRLVRWNEDIFVFSDKVYLFNDGQVTMSISSHPYPKPEQDQRAAVGGPFGMQQRPLSFFPKPTGRLYSIEGVVVCVTNNNDVIDLSKCPRDQYKAMIVDANSPIYFLSRHFIDTP